MNYFSKVSVILLLVGVITAGRNAAWADPLPEGAEDLLPPQVSAEDYSALKNQSPFLRDIGLSKSLVVTGIAHIEEEVFATLFDRETRESFLVGEETGAEGMQLVSISGDETDLETLTARIKVGGSEVVSIRYEKLSSKEFRKSKSRGKGPGGGTGPHGGADPRRLTADQIADAKKGARNYKEGFQADGYPDKPPPATVAKLQKLSTQQREAINVKMFEYRNRGLGLPERVKIYEGLLDRAVKSRR